MADHLHVTTGPLGDGQPARIDVTDDHIVVLAKGKVCIVGRVRHRDPWLTPEQARSLAAALTRVAGAA